MKFDIITLFPELIELYSSSSILGRAQKQNVISINTVNPRDFTKDKHKKVDDTPYGGGAGMVLMCDPIFSAVESIPKENNCVQILLTPQGQQFNQKMALELSKKDQLIMICGHYEGFDERIRTGLNVIELCIGDFVLTGGELPALCLIDAITRNVEGALGKIESAHEDTFSEDLLEYPQYTRPVEYRNMKVPDILLSGNHQEIARWRREQQFIRTYNKRPDLFKKFTDQNLSKEDKIIINKVFDKESESK